MSARFQELDWRPTPIGEISLRRRTDPVVQREVFEVKLDDEYLMSSLFTVAEEELARLGLARTRGEDLAVLVGGLGLGYTAVAALEDDRVRSLTVVEALDAVIDWHLRELLPVSHTLVADPRTTLAHGDFFALTAAGGLPGVGPAGRVYDAVLVDIDHTPQHVLSETHAGFYTVAGLTRLREQITVGGVFGLWSDDPPHDGFLTTLGSVFAAVEARVVDFPNPLTGATSSNTVYLGVRGDV
ncbi:MAG: spermidine synthase [Nocardioidaceae bacterium]